MKKVLQALFTLTMAGTLLAGVAVAENELNKPDHPHKAHEAGRHQGHHRGHWGKPDEMFDALNLTAEQKTQIQGFRQAFEAQNQAALDAMRSKYQQLRKVKQADNPDKAQLKALHTDLKKQRQALQPQQKALRQQILAVLTPEQRQQLKALHQKHKKDCPHDKQPQSLE